MSKIQNTPFDISRMNGCVSAAQPFIGKRVGKITYHEKFDFAKDPAVESLVKEYDRCNEHQILPIFHSAKNIYSLKNLFIRYEHDECAKQEGERVVKGLWGHWSGNEELAVFYKPHAPTMQKIISIRGDGIAFLKLCMKKYSSTLKSTVCNPKLPSAYLMAHDKAMVLAEMQEYVDEEEVEEETFDRSIVGIAKIDRKTKHVQLGFNL